MGDSLVAVVSPTAKGCRHYCNGKRKTPRQTDFSICKAFKRRSICNYFSAYAIIPRISKHKSTIAIGIHNGASIHNHDHAITLHNFRVMNMIVSNPQNPIPPLEVFPFLFICLSLILPTHTFSQKYPACKGKTRHSRHGLHNHHLKLSYSLRAFQ